MDYELKGKYIFCKPVGAKPARYLPRLKEGFRVMANVHAQLLHCGARKTWEKVAEFYWGITEEHVTWMIDHCWTCQLDKGNTTKLVITPIPSSKCNERLQISLMDFSTYEDDGYK